MYRIFVAADEFKGKRTIQQHRMINDVSIFFQTYRNFTFPLSVNWRVWNSLVND